MKSSWGHGHLTSRVTGSSTTSHWSFDITTSHWFLDPTGPSTSPRVTVSSTPLVLRHHHESLVHRPHWSFDITTRYWFLDHVPLVLQHHHESLVPRPHWSFDITTRYWFLDHVPLVLRRVKSSWGHGLVGYVAETGIVVRLSGSALKMVIITFLTFTVFL